jgi:hypothetical protein
MRVPAAALVALLPAALVALLPAGCAHPLPAAPVRRAALRANGVSVRVEVRNDGDGYLLEARFSPDRAGFHLYSVDLPDGGIDGLGFPTRIRVRGGLAATGRAVADAPLRTFRPAGLGVDLPVYPDGPVSIRMPVRSTAGPAEAVLTYAACSATQCLPPVVDRVVTLDATG